VSLCNSAPSSRWVQNRPATYAGVREEDRTYIAVDEGGLRRRCLGHRSVRVHCAMAGLCPGTVV
jgi:hypothetical protein